MKELPYFKFYSTEWMTGNIVYEPLDVQGLFINICALYWKNGGVLRITEIEQRYKKKTLIAKLTDRFFSVNDGFISISFLNEQLIERQEVSKTNSKNGLLGGRPRSEEKKANANPIQTENKPNESNKEVKQEVDIEKKKRKNKGVFTPPSFIDFEIYCKENGFQNIAERAFKGYAENDWKDSKNSPVLNWKSKLQNVWFNENNRDKKKTENETTATRRNSEPINPYDQFR